MRRPSEACLSYALTSTCTMNHRSNPSLVSPHLIELDEHDTWYYSLSGNLTIWSPPTPLSPMTALLKEQFGKCHTSLSHVATKKMFCGLRCAHPFQSQFSTAMGFSLHKDYTQQVLKITITIFFPSTHLQHDYDQSNSALETETTNLFWKVYQMDFKGGDLLLINPIERVSDTPN